MNTEEESNTAPSNPQEKEEENQTDNLIDDHEKANGTTPLDNILERIESSLQEPVSQKQEPTDEPIKEDDLDKSSVSNYLVIEENKSSDKETDNNDQNENKDKNNNDNPQEIFETTLPPQTISPTQDLQDNKSSSSSSLSSNADNEDHLKNDKELDEAIYELVHHFKPPAQELRTPITQLLERRRVEALIAGDYDLAEEQDKIAGILNTVLQNEQQKINEDKTIDILYSRWQQLIQKQNQINAKWDAKVQEFIAESDKQKQEMEIAHEEEVDNFISRWKDPNFLRPFNKPSSKLLQMREQEKAMAISRMYAQAKEMKAVADRLQREETQQAQAKISATMTMERNKLAAKQNKEENAWNSYRQRMLKSFQAERQKELRPVQTAMQQIKAKKSSPMKGSGAKRQHYGIPNSALPTLPNSRAESALSEASNKSGHSNKKGNSNANANANNNNNFSPRTQAIYTRFRSEKKTTLLDVGPVDEATLLSMKKPPTSRPRSTVGTATGRGPTVKRTQVSKKVPSRK